MPGTVLLNLSKTREGSTAVYEGGNSRARRRPEARHTSPDHENRERSIAYGRANASAALGTARLGTPRSQHQRTVAPQPRAAGSSTNASALRKGRTPLRASRGLSFTH